MTDERERRPNRMRSLPTSARDGTSLTPPREDPLPECRLSRRRRMSARAERLLSPVPIRAWWLRRLPSTRQDAPGPTNRRELVTAVATDLRCVFHLLHTDRTGPLGRLLRDSLSRAGLPFRLGKERARPNELTLDPVATKRRPRRSPLGSRGRPSPCTEPVWELPPRHR